MEKVKFPRIPHHPLSPGATSDDKRLTNMDHFKDKWVVITEKMDGECTGMNKEDIWARSLDSKGHGSLCKALHAQITHLLESEIIFGENMEYVHSLKYDNVEPFYMFESVFKDSDNNNKLTCRHVITLSLFAKQFNIPQPKILYEGLYSEEVVKKLIDNMDTNKMEGFVIRNWDEFLFEDYAKNVCKWVRPNHVQTNKHWSSQLIKNNIVYGRVFTRA